METTADRHLRPGDTEQETNLNTADFQTKAETAMINLPIRVLLVDDNLYDRELIRDALAQPDGNFDLTEASSAEEFQAQLQAHDYDLVLTDFNILGFEGLDVLDAVHCKNAETPVVVVTGTGSEEIAVEAMKNGAADYVIKTPRHLQRLPHTITTALELQYEHKERRRAEKALEESHALLKSVVEGIADAVFVKNRSGTYLLANSQCARMIGKTVNEMVGSDNAQHFYGKELQKINETDQKVMTARKALTFEAAITLRGKRTDLLTSKVPYFDDNGEVIGLIGISRDITERKRAEERLKKSRQQLRKLTAHIQTVREEERKRIAREIHDELGQTLSLLKIDLDWLRDKMSEPREVLTKKIDAMSDVLDGTIETVQRISSDLRPSLLDNLGLAAAIDWQAREIQERAGIKCELNLPCEDSELRPDVATALFRILQEALTNVVRHANATQVKINCFESADLDIFILRIEDNGIGITSEQVAASSSLGILGMRERLHGIGGTLNIAGSPEQGTILTVEIPLVNGLSKPR